MLFLINSDDKLFILALNADIAGTSALVVRIVLAQRVSLDRDLIAAGNSHVAPIGELGEFPVLIVGIQCVAVTTDTHLLGTALTLVDLHISLRRIDMGLVASLYEFDETRHLVVDDCDAGLTTQGAAGSQTGHLEVLAVHRLAELAPALVF